jgi:hypothetical protein
VSASTKGLPSFFPCWREDCLPYYAGKMNEGRVVGDYLGVQHYLPPPPEPALPPSEEEEDEGNRRSGDRAGENLWWRRRR